MSFGVVERSDSENSVPFYREAVHNYALAIVSTVASLSARIQSSRCDGGIGAEVDAMTGAGGFRQWTFRPHSEYNSDVNRPAPSFAPANAYLDATICQRLVDSLDRLNLLKHPSRPGCLATPCLRGVATTLGHRVQRIMNIGTGTVVFLHLLNKVWPWCITSRQLSLLTRNAYPLPWLDVRDVSCQGVRLLVALIPEFQSVRAGDSTTREHVATVNGVVDAISDRPADGTDGAKDRDCLARRGSDSLPARLRWQRAYRDKQGTYCKAWEDAERSCFQNGAFFPMRDSLCRPVRVAIPDNGRRVVPLYPASVWGQEKQMLQWRAEGPRGEFANHLMAGCPFLWLLLSN